MATQFYADEANGWLFYIASDAELHAYDLEGNEKSVEYEGDAELYLDTNSFAWTTLDNTTYLVNRGRTVSMIENTVVDVISWNSIVYVLGGQYSRSYKITVNWNDATTPFTARTINSTHTTPDGSNTAHGAQIATDYIASEIKTDLDAITTNSFNTLFDVDRVGDVLYIRWADSTRTDPFTVTVEDGEGGLNFVAVNNSVSDVGKLPRYAPHGYHVTITGDGSAGVDDWYVEFSATPNSQGQVPVVGSGFGESGIWVETVQKDIPFQLDPLTMPHILEYDSTGDKFVIKQGEWEGRQVGDELTNENPSFVGKTIEDIGYFQGRLVVLSGHAVVMSRTNRPLDFWIESATAQTDTDAIDIESTSPGSGLLRRLIPHNRDLVVFSDKAQFIVFGRNSLTPENAALVLTTSFESNTEVTPVAGGRNVFFPINYGAYTGVREFYTEGSQDINDSRAITQHVLKYIEGRATRLASTSNFDLLCVQAEDPTKLYIYEYIWLNDQKAQASWSVWLLPNPVEYFFFVENVLHIVSLIDNELHLEKIDLDVQADDGLNYTVYLDRKISVEGVNTEIVQPYDHMPDTDDMLFIQGEGCPNPGMLAEVDSVDEDEETGEITITLKDDMDGGTVIMGQKFRSAYRPTMPCVKDEDGTKIGTAKLVISKFEVNVQDSGSMEARIISPYRDDVYHKFSGRFVGDPNTVVGEAAIVSTTYTVPYRDDADYGELELFSESHEPLTIMDIEWRGQYTKKGVRITQGGN